MLRKSDNFTCFIFFIFSKNSNDAEQTCDLCSLSLEKSCLSLFLRLTAQLGGQVMQKSAPRTPASPHVPSPASPSTCSASPDVAADALMSEIKRLAKSSGRDASAQLIRACQEALRSFPKEAYRHGVLQPLWTPHYNSLRECEKRIADAADEPVALQQARAAFGIVSHSAKRHLVELQGIVAPRGNTSFGRQLLYKLQVFTGDVERYEERNACTSAPSPLLASAHSDMSDVRACMSSQTYSRCIGTYIAASKLLPQNGLAYNQLGVVYESKRDPFLATYFYVRACFAEQKPFEKAPESLARVLTVASADAALDDAVQNIFFAARGFLSAALVAQSEDSVLSSQRFPGHGDGSVADLAASVRVYVSKHTGMFNPREMILERLVLLLITASSASILELPMTALLETAVVLAEWAAGCRRSGSPAIGTAKESSYAAAIAGVELFLRWVALSSPSALDYFLKPTTCAAFRKLNQVVSELLLICGEQSADAAWTLAEDEEILGLRSFTGTTSQWGKKTTTLSVAMSQNPLLLGKVDAAGVSTADAVATRLSRLKGHWQICAARLPMAMVVEDDKDADDDDDEDEVVYNHDALEAGS